MLNPYYDRIDYGRMVSPPDGYQLDFAVGTTYSLDLNALTGISLSLGLSAETDSAIAGSNPVYLLEALRSTADKVALFCEAGQIHAPVTEKNVYIFLEKMICQVDLGKKRGNTVSPSFHPKFWLLRYMNDLGKVHYRFVVMSRNLTFDRSWDVAYFMDGELTESGTDKNRAVADFLSFLTDYLPAGAYYSGKKKKIISMAKELRHVQFDLSANDPKITDYEFLPIGVPDSSGGFYDAHKTRLFTHDGCSEMALISPFLSAETVRDFNRRAKKDNQLLITRMFSLGKLKPEDCSRFDLYVMRDELIAADPEETTADNHDLGQDIHAKLYLLEGNWETEIYLGSMNSSWKAVSGNVEFMIMLKTRWRHIGLSKLRESLLIDKPDSPFVKVDLPSKDDPSQEDEASRLQDVIKEIIHKKPTAAVEKVEEKYKLTVSLKRFKPFPYTVSISPLPLSYSKIWNAADVVFDSLALTQLSTLYRIRVYDGDNSVERVIVIPTSGIPEEREHEIVTGIIKDKNGFYQYIYLLLGDTFLPEHDFSGDGNDQGDGSGQSHSAPYLPALYEKMLQTAASRPEKLRELDSVLKSVNDSTIIPDDFRELYKTFREVVK